MNKVGKTMMYVMGGSVLAGVSYYMGLPKSKKNQVKSKMGQMIKSDKDFLDEFSD